MGWEMSEANKRLFNLIKQELLVCNGAFIGDAHESIKIICLEFEQRLAQAQKERDHQRGLFELVGKSVCAALERAGFDSVDDPGESIDVLAEERDRFRAELAQLNSVIAAKNEVFQNIIEECGNRPFTRMLAIGGFELTDSPTEQPK